MTRDPARRLGSSKEDAEEIKRQPFFRDVSFDDVLNKRIPPPYFPTIVSIICFDVLRLLPHRFYYRMVAQILATLTKNSRVSNQRLPPSTANCLLATKRSSTDSPMSLIGQISKIDVYVWTDVVYDQMIWSSMSVMFSYVWCRSPFRLHVHTCTFFFVYQCLFCDVNTCPPVPGKPVSRSSPAAEAFPTSGPRMRS